MLYPVLMFLAVACGLAGLYSLLADLYLRDRSRMAERVDEEFRKRQRDKVRKSPLFKKVAAPSGGLPGLDAPVSPAAETDPPFQDRLRLVLEQSGAGLTLEQAVGASLAVALVAGLATLVFLGPWAAAPAAGAGLAVVPLYVRHRYRAREAKLLNQLPDAFDLMARVIRAGHSVPQSLQSVADEFDAPVSAEFAYCQEQQNLGLMPEHAFRDLASRSNIMELKIFVMAMLIQRQTGGNLAELLERLAATVRERVRLQGHIQTLTAEGRLQAVVLLVLPPVMFGVMLLVNRSYALALFEHPWLILATLASMAVGTVWIQRIVQIDA